MKRFLRVGEVAPMFGVSAKTVNRWARMGKLHAIRTLGGHFRFDAGLVGEALEEKNASSNRDGQ